MANWIEDLNQFLGDKGMKQKFPEFNSSEELEIQKASEEIIKPIYEKIKQQLDLYPNQKADIITSKKTTYVVIEQVEFRIYKTTQPKFTYRISFFKVDNDIYAKGQFCIPNLYGENINFTDTSFSKLLSDLLAEDIGVDFTNSFKANFDKK